MRQRGLSRKDKQKKDRHLATEIQRKEANAWRKARENFKKESKTILSSTKSLPSLLLECNEENPAARRLRRRMILTKKKSTPAAILSTKVYASSVSQNVSINVFTLNYNCMCACIYRSIYI